MSTIVTRLYEDPANADAAVETLKAEGFPESCMSVVEQASRRSAQDMIEEAGVPADAAQQYAQHLTANRALLVVRAPFAPFGAARRAIEVADSYPAFNAGVANENMNIPEEPNPELFLSILPSHRLFLTNMLDVRNDLKPRGFSRAFGIPTLSEKPKKRMRPAVIDQRFADFAFPLLSRRHRKMTRKHTMDRFFATFILPHIWRRKPKARVGAWRYTT
ncbi:hypothetical protein [Gymnodinialimonas hymeniacidonis]|uniref:hypothetical protein n=1 Tax=Gymnodinialimonas hymeniacidonis TaxID=3126508 RepID=UPI0034C69968